MKVETVKFMIWAEDMDRAVAFYRDVLGLEVSFQDPHWSEMRHGDAVVALHGGGTGELQITGLGFQVDDVETAARAVAEGGGAIRRPPERRPTEPIILAEVVDPEGNGFTLTQYLGA